MSVLAPSIGVLWKLVESHGIDPEPLFVSEGLPVDLPIEPGTRVPYHAVDRVRGRAAMLSGDPSFGLGAASFVHPSQLGALGYAWLASTSMRTAFERLQRYARVVNDHARVDLAREDGNLVMRLSIAQPSINQRVRDDGQMAFIVSLCRMNLGQNFNPQWVAFTLPEPPDRAPYASLFRCPLRFDAPANGLAISKADADRTLPSANPLLAKMNERVVNQRLAALDKANIPNRVRAEIMEQLPSGGVSDESVAEALHMTSRTLHRRLKDDGLSFREVLGEVRRSLAEQYISDPTLTLTEITFLLGFAEASSFSRAYRRWTGESPSSTRQSVTGSA